MQKFISVGAAMLVLLIGAAPGVSGAATKAAPAPPAIRFRALALQLRGRTRARSSRPAPFESATAAALVPGDTVHDPIGDVPLPQGDITAAGFAQSASNFVFGTKVLAPTDPRTDPAWQQGLVFVAWALDANNDGSPEYIVFVGADGGGGLVSILLGTNSNDQCDGTAKYVAGYGYTATFPKHCLPAGFAFRFQAAFGYTTDPNDPNAPLDIAPDDSFSPVLVTTKVAGPSGYWMLGADGRVYAFGGAVGYAGVVPGAVAMAPRRDGSGYWITNGAGYVRAYGSALGYGGRPPLTAGEHIVSIAATPSGNGYWLFSDQGSAFTFGDAHLYGDMSGTPLNGSIVASAATPSGHGYYMIGSDGGIFAFGDARFYGSMGGTHLNKAIVGMSAAPSGGGYWLVGGDGGVFAFRAPFRGSMGSVHLNQPVDGLVAYGNGYLLGAADGGVFNFSDRSFVGSLANDPPPAPIIGLAAFGS
jgi:hypothetical protein